MRRIILPLFLLIGLSHGDALANDSPDRYLTVAAVGDIMMGTTHPKDLLPPKDGADIFKKVTFAIAGNDIAFGNLEGPLIDGGETTKCEKYNYCFAFRTPTRYVHYLKGAGFMAMGIANNHANDFGKEGRMSTLRTLSGAGIQPVGGKAIALFTLKGKRIAIAGFSYSTSTPYSFSILNIPKAEEIVGKLTAENDVVIVSFHGGSEGRKYQHVPGAAEIFMGEERGDVMKFARAVIDAGADMVIGHGPHVLRAMEVYRGRLIAYSLGNFLTYARFNLKGPNGISAVLNARLNAETGEFLEGTIVPVKLVGEGIPVPDENKQAIRIIERLTRQDFPDSNLAFHHDGTIRTLERKKVDRDKKILPPMQ